MAKIYYSSQNNPYQNIASEYQILKEVKEPTLYLWVNQPCVIAGKNQNTYAEWNLDLIVSRNILPVRRLSGGGCVFHDLGNLNFSFFDVGDTPNVEFLDIIIKAVRRFCINVRKSGRNDLCVDNKKIGGTAYLVEDGKYLLHGTLMVDVNLDVLSQVLQPNVKKYENRGIVSVKSRVANLSTFASNLSVVSLAKAIVEVFQETYPNTTIKSTPIYLELSQKLSSRKWIYGDIGHDILEFHYQTSCGVVTVQVKVRDGFMEKVNIYTDSLDPSLSSQLQHYLFHKPLDKLEFLIRDYIENSYTYIDTYKEIEF